MVGRRNYTFDANMLVSDGVSAITAAGWAQVSGAQGIVDLGGNQGITITLPSIANSSSITPQQARIDLAAVIYVNAATISGSNFYKVYAVGSNSPSFASGNVTLGAMVFGKGAAMDVPNSGDSHAPAGAGNYPAGDFYEMMFTNEFNGVPQEYVSLYVAGTFGSITLYSYLAVLPRI